MQIKVDIKQTSYFNDITFDISEEDFEQIKDIQARMNGCSFDRAFELFIERENDACWIELVENLNPSYSDTELAYVYDIEED